MERAQDTARASVGEDAVHEPHAQPQARGVQFHGTGLIPPVSTGGQQPAQPSASDRAYGKPVKVNYISDTTDKVMALDRLLAHGEVVGDNIADMVEKVLAKAAGHPIKYLRIDGHGAPGYQEVGEHGAITNHISDAERSQLMRLRGHFTSDALVFLEGCEVAAGTDGEHLLAMLSEMWNVKVTGGVAYQRPLPGHEGSEVTAQPDGHGGTQVSTQESAINEFWRVDPDTLIHAPKVRLDYYRKQGATMSLTWRYEQLIYLLDGRTPADAQEGVMVLFQVSKPEDRRELYRLVENHKWSGDFQHGWLTDDDSLWNNLTTEQLATLKKLLNE
jgi:hypothetical protein